MGMNVALLRAVNVAGHQMIAMADLRAFFEALGFDDVQTLLQSGNVIFRSGVIPSREDGEESPSDRRRRGLSRSSALGMTELLEREAKKRLGFATDFFIRTADEWQTIVDRNPFTAEAKNDPGRLVVAVLKGAGRQFDWPGPEIAHVDGRNAYIFYPDGQGRSKLTAAVIEKKSGTRCTARNWNTVTKLNALLR
jgi:uncharacterized protein (DUF1697 family)